VRGEDDSGWHGFDSQGGRDGTPRQKTSRNNRRPGNPVMLGLPDLRRIQSKRAPSRWPSSARAAKPSFPFQKEVNPSFPTRRRAD